MALELDAQPLTSVTVTVYCVVCVGNAFGVAELDPVKEESGDHSKLTPPEADKPNVSPTQIVVVIGLITAVGSVNTVTVT